MSSDKHPGLSRKFTGQQRQRLMTWRQELLGGEENTLANERAFQTRYGDEAAEAEDAS